MVSLQVFLYAKCHISWFFTNRTVIFTNQTVIFTNQTIIFTNRTVISTNQILFFLDQRQLDYFFCFFWQWIFQSITSSLLSFSPNFSLWGGFGDIFLQLDHDFYELDTEKFSSQFICIIFSNQTQNFNSRL